MDRILGSDEGFNYLVYVAGKSTCYRFFILLKDQYESLAESIDMRLGEYDGYEVVGAVLLVIMYGMVVEFSGYH